MKLIVLILVMFLVSACTDDPLLNPNPVQLQGDGNYIYHFKYSDGCLTDEQIKTCAETQLRDKKLIPAECANGIEVLWGNGPSGGGWLKAKFHCRAQ